MLTVFERTAQQVAHLERLAECFPPEDWATTLTTRHEEPPELAIESRHISQRRSVARVAVEVTEFGQLSYWLVKRPPLPISDVHSPRAASERIARLLAA